MAATDGRRPKRRVRRLRKLPWIAAGIGVLAARDASAQSNIDFRYLYYQESNGRTKVLNPTVLLHEDFGLTGGALNLLIGYDTISGASPTGGYPTLDTTTSASGTVSASGNFPQVNYNDTRKSGTISYAHKFGAHLPSIDVSYSKENDYRSRGAGLADEWSLAGGRGTLHLALSATRDVVTPVTTRIDHDKSSRAFALGWTWILTDRDLFDVSASLTQLSGYLDDPYKIVPVGTAVAPEHRPDSRSRKLMIFKYGHYFDGVRGALKANYRYYFDDWAIRAHTLDFVYDQRVGPSWIVTPQVRLYRQNGASFYGNSFATAQTYMSSDYRLAPFDSVMAGVGVAYEFPNRLTLSLAGTYTSQRGGDRVIPLAATPPPVTPLAEGEDGGTGPPLVSSADLTVVTWTFGLTWRY